MSEFVASPAHNGDSARIQSFHPVHRSRIEVMLLAKAGQYGHTIFRIPDFSERVETPDLITLGSSTCYRGHRPAAFCRIRIGRVQPLLLEPVLLQFPFSVEVGH